jgi:hypothetical protein
MQWREFTAGELPPDVEFMDPDAGGGEADAGTGGTGGGGGGDIYVNLTEVAGANGVYSFQPMPMGVFGSDGVADRFELVQRATSLFTNTNYKDMNDPTNDPEGACEPCVPGV